MMHTKTQAKALVQFIFSGTKPFSFFSQNDIFNLVKMNKSINNLRTSPLIMSFKESVQLFFMLRLLDCSATNRKYAHD